MPVILALSGAIAVTLLSLVRASSSADSDPAGGASILLEPDDLQTSFSQRRKEALDDVRRACRIA